MKTAVVWIVILAVLGGGGYAAWRWYDAQPKAGVVSYRTATVKLTDITSSISATGTVVPEDVVDVGAQVNGLIATFGKDTDGKPVDYRSTVQEGMVLATIDEALYAADVAAGEAQRASALAQIKVAEASREQAKARVEQTQRDWARSEKLGTTSRALSQAEYDLSKSAYEQAVASEALAVAQITQAQASVAGADASLLRSRRNLAYCIIKSPVSGVIIDRRVDIGQTVVASLNAPSLFLIAKDLTQMMVLVQVNEADIGSVHPGEPVTFGVDAFPGQVFKGSVRKVRLNASVTQNVVTYTVEIVTENKDLKLLPYLTANVKFETGRRDQVLSVPNAALRWAPAAAPGADSATPAPTSASAAGAPTSPATSPQAGGNGRPDRSAGDKAAGEDAAKPRKGRRTAGTVWVLEDGTPKSISVKVGLSDGTITEVQSDDLKDGMTVIVGETSPTQAADTGTKNPFAPPTGMGGGRRGGGR